MLPRIRELRMEQGISQQQLADAVFVTQPSINKYENHNIEPEIAIPIRIADFLIFPSITSSVIRTCGKKSNQRNHFCLMPRKMPFFFATAD